MAIDDGHPERKGEVFRIAKAGKYQAMTGEVVLTPEHLTGIVDCFAWMVKKAKAAGGEPAYPVGKVDHIDTPATRAVGVFRDLWVDAKGWLSGELIPTDEELAGHIATGALKNVSAEIDFDVEVYGKKFPARLVAVALLPAEAYPAIPGAGSVRVVASGDDKASERVRILLASREDEPERGDGENMEKLEAMLQQILEGLSSMASGLTALTAKLDALAESQQSAPPAAPAEDTQPDKVNIATPADEPAEDELCSDTDKNEAASSLAAFRAAIAETVKRGAMTRGEAEEMTRLGSALPAKARVALAATFAKRPVPAATEKIPNASAKPEMTAEEKQAKAQELVLAKLREKPNDYARAVLAAKREAPELFAVKEG